MRKATVVCLGLTIVLLMAGACMAELIDGAIYINSTLTNHEGINGPIDMEYVMQDNILIENPSYALVAFTYNHSNMPNYEWSSFNEGIVQVVVDPNSYANSRAILILPTVQQAGSTLVKVVDIGNNNAFKILVVKVQETILPMPINGDINGDSIVDLQDAILALQICAHISPSDSICLTNDVNSDGKIGIEEVIYILEKEAGMRE